MADPKAAALNGDMPQWFVQHYETADGYVDYARLWQSVIDVSDTPIFSRLLRDLEHVFGGYCFGKTAVYAAANGSADLPQGAQQPWVEGGCL